MPYVTGDGNTADRYWAAGAAQDWDTVHEIARVIVGRLLAEADEPEEQGTWVAPTSLRLEARAIERGDVAPFPPPVPPLV